MIVVFDTNIWISQLGLRSPSATAVRYFLKKEGAQLALPEIVRLEVEHELRNRLQEFIRNIQENYHQLLTAFGHLKEVVLPSSEEIEKKVLELFDTVDVNIKEIPFTLDSARSSFIKTINKQPPSDKDQQFKDGVLWADCAHLLENDDVILVSADKGFYQDRDYSKGPETSLAAEVRGAPHKLRLLSNIGDLLKEIQQKVDLDEELLVSSFFEQNRVSINEILDRQGFILGSRLNLTRTLYITENPGLLFLEFSMEYECQDISGSNRNSAILKLKGDGIYNTLTGQFERLRNFGEELRYHFEDGTEYVTRNYVLFGVGMVFGHKEITNTFQYKID